MESVRGANSLPACGASYGLEFVRPRSGPLPPYGRVRGAAKQREGAGRPRKKLCGSHTHRSDIRKLRWAQIVEPAVFQFYRANPSHAVRPLRRAPRISPRYFSAWGDDAPLLSSLTRVCAPACIPLVHAEHRLCSVCASLLLFLLVVRLVGGYGLLVYGGGAWSPSSCVAARTRGPFIARTGRRRLARGLLIVSLALCAHRAVRSVKAALPLARARLDG